METTNLTEEHQDAAGLQTTEFIQHFPLANEVSSQSELVPSKRKAGRRKIPIEFIEDKSRRQITFSKRKAGLMKKAYELTTLTGTQALLLVASETGHVYTFATPKLQPFVTIPEGKSLIQACLNAPDPNATGQLTRAQFDPAKRDEEFEAPQNFTNQQEQSHWPSIS